LTRISAEVGFEKAVFIGFSAISVLENPFFCRFPLFEVFRFLICIRLYLTIYLTIFSGRSCFAANFQTAL